MELKKYKLGDIAEIISGVAFQPSDICNEGVRILRGGNIQSQRIIIKDDDVFLPLYYINEENQVKIGDTILVASTGSVEVLGKAATCFDEMKNTQIGAFLRIIRPKEERYSMLISIALNSEYFAKYIKAQARGTSINNITIGYLKEFEIYYPKNYLPICDFYQTLEKKIALNRKINDNLEAMAKQLYDYWFVQFDFPNEEGKPYKSSGGKMVWNEKLKREIPEGWEVKKISEIANTYSGGTPTSTNQDYYVSGNIPWINSGELNNPIITNTSKYITELGLNNSSAKLYPPNTILVALYGATAGKVSLLSFEACSNQAICGVMPIEKVLSSYMRYYLESLYNYFITLSSGSARDNISQDTIKNTILPIPPRDLLKKFEDIAKPVINKVIDYQKQIETLTKQRDELLPLLMNGQVSVN